MVQRMSELLKKAKYVKVVCRIIIDGLEVASAHNAKDPGDERHPETHAEQIALSQLGDVLNGIMYISIPPCAECFKLIAESGKISKIYWLFDKHGKDTVKVDPLGKIKIEQYKPKDKNEIDAIKMMKHLYNICQNTINK